MTATQIHPGGVSAIICCYNSSKLIGETLRCLQQQNFSAPVNWEVILVDNNSNDNTAENARQHWIKNDVTDFTIRHESSPGQTFARRNGAAAARYSYLTFIDDDNRVADNWIESVFRFFEDRTDFSAIGGKNEAVFEGHEPWWFETFKQCFAVGRQGTHSGPVATERSFLWGAGFSIRKNAWDTVWESGFPGIQHGRKGKNLRAGEDTEFCFALQFCGHRLYYEESLKLFHFMPDKRMKDHLLLELMEGFGRDEVVLSVYRSMIIPSKKPKVTWWFEAAAFVKHYLLFVLKTYRTGKRQRFIFKVWNRYYTAYISELFNTRKSFKNVRDRIIGYKQRCSLYQPIPGASEPIHFLNQNE